MGASRQFNRLLAHAAIGVLCGGAAHADDIRKWTDAQGNVHYSVTGKVKPGSSSARVPVLRGRAPNEEETFSIRASLRRREIETSLQKLGVVLDRVRAEQQRTRASRFSARIPSAVRDPDDVRAVHDAQRDLFLASSQFEQEKAETLRKLRRQERQTLEDLAGRWKEFAALESEIRARYGETPIWFRPRLACGTCLSAEQVAAALQPKKVEPTGQAESDAAAASAEDEDWGEEDEDWQ